LDGSLANYNCFRARSRRTTLSFVKCISSESVSNSSASSLPRTRDFKTRCPHIVAKMRIFLKILILAFSCISFCWITLLYEQVVPDHYRVTRKEKTFTVLANDIASTRDFGTLWCLLLRLQERRMFHQPDIEQPSGQYRRTQDLDARQSEFCTW